MSQDSTYPKDRKPSFLHKLLLGQEKSRFEQFMEISLPVGRILSNGLLGGMAKGFGAVVGASVVATIVMALLGFLGHHVPGAAGKFILGVNHTAQEKVGFK